MDAKAILKQLSLEEKLSLCVGGSYFHTKPIPRLNIPPILLLDGPNGINLVEINNDRQYLHEGQIKTICFPSACCTCCSFDRDNLYKMGEAIGDGMVKDGVSVILGPSVNIKRSPLCGRNYEYFSEDPFLATTLAGSLIKGIQSKGVGACVKHFAANNQETRRFSISAQIDERTFHEIYLSAFEGLVKDAKPWIVMASYNKINDVYSALNHELLTHILREEWKWNLNTDENSPIVEGVVVSDWGGIVDRLEAFKAGVDLAMPGDPDYDFTPFIKAVQNKELDEDIVNKAAERVLNIVFKAQEIIEKSKIDSSIQYGVGMENVKGMLSKQHKLSREVAENSIVLLKNDDSLLPLPISNEDSKEIKILYVGEFAKKPHFQGYGSARVDPYKVDNCYHASVDLLESHPSKGGRISVSYVKGFDTANGKLTEESKSQTIESAKFSDIVVVFAGTPQFLEIENQDLEDIRLPSGENELIEEISKVNKNVAVVLQTGSAVEMPWINNVKSVVETYFCGESGGKAIANILFGLVNPSGHLCESFPIRNSDNPSYENFPGEEKVVNYAEGVFVGYRYYDTKNVDVLFPFGHGLSYTTFKLSNIRIRDGDNSDLVFADNDPNIFVCVDIENAGERAGKAVAQMYVSDQTGKIERPFKELKDFEKIYLEPGEKKSVQFHLNQRSFAWWNVETHNWSVSSGDFNIIIGQSSKDENSVQLKLKIKSTTEK